ncbi:hypothetical protein NGRA_1206 [Nosema granulosis]|uniref:Uncharacterized protein n=1 Tax=Nosema granulosis TaxID=83296 RepID=A0A9P6H268_9MICR|nr:hypothetical protein NGRA_1206 [Nosema granulosis]
MKEFHKILDVPQEKPADWDQDSRIVNVEEGPAKILTSFTQEEKNLIFKRRILVLLPKKGPPRRNRYMAEDEGCQEAEQDKTLQNNTLQEKAVFWLIRNKESKILGPFTNKEMQEKIKEGELVGLAIKRDDDKAFVDYDKVSGAVANVLDTKEYEKFISDESNSSISKEKACEKLSYNSPPTGSRYDILFLDEQKSNLKGKVSDDSSLYKDFVKDFKASLKTTKNVFHVDNNSSFLRSKEFLRDRNSPIEVQNIIQKIYGKTRANAINIVCLLTMLNKEDCEKLITLILKESGCELLSDTNEDGFVKVLKKQTRR